MFWHRNIPLRFQRLLLTSFLPLIYSLLLILFKRITQIIFERKVCSHMFWHQNLLFGFKWLLLACFEPKINFLLTWFLPFIFHSIPKVIVDLFFINNLLMSRFFIQKNLSDFIWKKKKKKPIILSCFDRKISYLGSNPSACFGPKMKFWFGFEAYHCPCILGNLKHQFLFQNVILDSFWPQKDRIDFILINIVMLTSFLT